MTSSPPLRSTASTPARPFVAPAASPPLERVGCSLLTFHGDTREEALQQIATRGFRAVDVAAIPGFCDHLDPRTIRDAELEELAARLRRDGLRVSSLNVHPGDMAGPDDEGLRAFVIATLNAARRLGARVITLPPGRAVDEASWDEAAAVVARRVRPLLDLADAAGVRLSLEAPHAYTLAEDLAQAGRLFAAVGDPRLGCTLDTSHAQRRHRRPLAEAVAAVGAEVVHVHLRDTVRGHITVTPGKGDCDYVPFFQALAARGYGGDFNFELEYEGAPREVIAQELDFAREHMRLLLSGARVPFSHALYHQGWYRAFDATRDAVLHPREFVVARPRLKAVLRPPVRALKRFRAERLPHAELRFETGWRRRWYVGHEPSAIAARSRPAATPGGAKRVAILGCGYTGRYMHGPGFAGIEALNVVGVCDVQQERVDRLARELGCPAFTDAAELIRSTKPDLVVNCTREWQHHPTTLLAFEHGADVFCEKIMAEDLAKGEDMVRAAREAGRTLGVNYNWRFLPGVQKLKELAASRQLGALRALRLLAHADVHHHALDLARFIGGPVRSVYAAIRDEPEQRGFKAWNAYVGEMLYMPSVYCMAVLETSEGAGVTLTSTSLFDPGAVLLTIDAFFEKGTVTLSGVSDRDAYGSLTGATQVPVDLRLPAGPGSRNFSLSFQRSIEAFAAAYAERRDPPVTGADALEVMRLEKALVDSARAGAKVVL